MADSTPSPSPSDRPVYVVGGGPAGLSVAYAELALGLGLILGLLTPVALVGGLLLNALYFTLMIHDWAEQGQNSMMALISVVGLFGMSWQTWSLDHALGWF